MRQAGRRKKALLAALFGVLFTLGAATAAFTAGAAPFGAEATTTIVTTITTGSSTVVSTITTTTPDSTSSTGSTTGSTSTATTTITTTTTTPAPRKITICHHARGKKGAVKHVTIRINRSAWTAHQKHGDSLGACNTASAKKFHSRAAHIKKWHKKKK